MLLKQFPDDIKLGVMIEMIATLLQSILMRAQAIIESRDDHVHEDDVTAMTSLGELLDTAKHDVEKLQKRMMN